MAHIANRTVRALQQGVEEALTTALGGLAPHIGVAADHGEVTLTGHLTTAAEALKAHKATLAVWGVHSLADDIVESRSRFSATSDTNIALQAQRALQHATGVPTDSVRAEVRDHAVTLSGTVSSAGERLAAERAVSYLPGLTRIDNQVTVDKVNNQASVGKVNNQVTVGKVNNQVTVGKVNDQVSVDRVNNQVSVIHGD